MTRRLLPIFHDVLDLPDKSNQNAQLTANSSIASAGTSSPHALRTPVCHIDHLPPEILSPIFTLVLIAETQHIFPAPSILGPFCLGPPATLVRLLTVCRRWHDTLIHTTHLWSLVDHQMYTKQPTKHEHYLHRNPTGPLFVYLSNRPRSTHDYGFSSLLPEIGARVEELRVAHMPMRFLSFDFPADRLLACTLHYVGGIRLPPVQELFNGHAPRLRALDLTGLSFIPSNTFPSLTHLIISQIDIRPGKGFSLTDLFTFISGCPALEDVHLQVSRPGHAPSPVARSALPQLRRLVIDGNGSNQPAIEISHHLDLSPDCLTCVELNCLPDLQSGMDALVDIGPRERELSWMRILPTSEWDYGCLYYILHLTDDQHSPGIRIDLKSYWSWVRMKYEEGRGNIHTALSTRLFRDVRTLHISAGELAWLTESPFHVLHALTRVTALVITKPVRELRKALASLTATDDAPTAFPELSTLALLKATRADLDAVRAVLQSRRQAGSWQPLRHLVLVVTRSTARGRSARLPRPALHSDRSLEDIRDLIDQLTVLGREEAEKSLPEELRWPYPTNRTQEFSDSEDYWPSWERYADRED
ncbi:hypothetical protein C8Q80DRAFT_1274410 [Daedaleopsis nitida]|nr:hypothetical protein C8Q80DRAFT_1274410 [Daedaleopsis nitida]